MRTGLRRLVQIGIHIIGGNGEGLDGQSRTGKQN
jgi:hypothetical protein